jgi:hypothetical protein
MCASDHSLQFLAHGSAWRRVGCQASMFHRFFQPHPSVSAWYSLQLLASRRAPRGWGVSQQSIGHMLIQSALLNVTALSRQIPVSKPTRPKGHPQFTAISSAVERMLAGPRGEWGWHVMWRPFSLDGVASMCIYVLYLFTSLFPGLGCCVYSVPSCL